MTSMLDQWEAMMQAEDLAGGRQRQGADAEEPPRLAVRREEAARMLGIGIDSLDEHVLPEIATVRLGRRVLVPVEELHRWIARRASCVGAGW